MYLLFRYSFLFFIFFHPMNHSFRFYNMTQNLIKKMSLYSSNSRNYLHHIVNKKKDKHQNNEENETYLVQNDFLQGKRLISISPGGFKGFYLFGVLSYIKDNYDLTNYIYSGASAGAWNALFMCIKNNNSHIRDMIQEEDIKKIASVYELEQKIKSKLLSYYKNREKENEFDFRRLFIGVTTINHNYQPDTTIYNDFESLEDAIDCCIASSHIPFITGGLINKYNGRMNFDGGFKKNPYLNINKSVLHISPSMWIKIKNSRKDGGKDGDKNEEKHEGHEIPVKEQSSLWNDIHKFLYQTNLLKKDNIDFFQLYEEGYREARENKAILDDIIVHKNYTTNYYYT